MSSKQITLPVEGMTCASCVSHVEGALKKVQTVENVNVNLATERANLSYDDAQIDVLDLVEAVGKTGYTIPVEKTVLPIGGMTCASCVAHVEGALRDVPGVVDVNVNLATPPRKRLSRTCLESLRYRTSSRR